MCGAVADVRYGPKADIDNASFNYIIGTQQDRRAVECGN